MFVRNNTFLLCALAAALVLGCTPTKPDDGITDIIEGGNNNDEQPQGQVMPDGKNTDKAIELTIYDATARSAYFKGVFGDALPEGYTKTPPRGFMYSTKYSDPEDIYMYGTWVEPFKYKTEGDADNVFRAYVSDLVPGATVYVMACVDYVNEVTYRYSPVIAMKTVVASDYNGHEYVDLGLSVKWAKCNVGASTETGKGSYFSWGETKTKDNYSASYYKFYAGKNNTNGWALYSKYVNYVNNGVVDNIVALQPEDDAARAVMGGTWRTPHDSELEELVKKCSWIHEDGGVTILGPNGNTLFLPITGIKSGEADYWEDCGYYLGAELSRLDSDGCCCLKFTRSSKSEALPGCGRTGGYVIRAVTE